MKMPFIRQLTAIKSQQSPIHIFWVSFFLLTHISSPNGSKLIRHSPTTNLLTCLPFFVWIPLNLFQLVAQAGGPLDGHCSIKEDHMGTGYWADTPNFLEWAHLGAIACEPSS